MKKLKILLYGALFFVTLLNSACDDLLELTDTDSKEEFVAKEVSEYAGMWEMDYGFKKSNHLPPMKAVLGASVKKSGDDVKSGIDFAPFNHPTWQQSIVVRSSAEGSPDAFVEAPIALGDDIYMGLCFINQGSSDYLSYTDSDGYPIDIRITWDNVEVNVLREPQLQANSYLSIWNNHINNPYVSIDMSIGYHTLSVELDATGLVSETSEENNIITRQVYIAPPNIKANSIELLESKYIVRTDDEDFFGDLNASGSTLYLQDYGKINISSIDAYGMEGTLEEYDEDKKSASVAVNFTAKRIENKGYPDDSEMAMMLVIDGWTLTESSSSNSLVGTEWAFSSNMTYLFQAKDQGGGKFNKVWKYNDETSILYGFEGGSNFNQTTIKHITYDNMEMVDAIGNSFYFER